MAQQLFLQLRTRPHDIGTAASCQQQTLAALTGIDARLRADVVRNSFIVVDLHHLLLADLEAHFVVGQPEPCAHVSGGRAYSFSFGRARTLPRKRRVPIAQALGRFDRLESWVLIVPVLELF